MSEVAELVEVEETTAAQPEASIELDLPAEDLALLLGQPELLHPNSRRRLVSARPTKRSEIWHDTPEGELAAAGLSLAQTHVGGAPVWRLQRLVPAHGDLAPPGQPAQLVGEHDSPPAEITTALVPIAAFDGHVRVLRPQPEPPHVVLIQGELRAVQAVKPICRVILSGAGAGALAQHWAVMMRLRVPQASLAGEALALSGRTLPARPLGAPSLSADQSVSDGFAAVIAHLCGVLVHYAPSANGTNGPEPVHQMRVALRRLRSAISLFRRATFCPELEAATAQLKQLGHVLGPARDWDVFTQGTGIRISEAFPDDTAIRDLLSAAGRKRRAGYTALVTYLASAEWRELGITLARLALERPWEAGMSLEEAEAVARHETLHAHLPDFASRMLQRRYRSLIAPGADLSGLEVEALHEIRLAGKRLRYAAEFFAPLFPGRGTKRFLRRLTALQERLGQLNDGAVAADLMAQLVTRTAARAGAIGVVRGFVAASSGSGRRRIERCWKRLLRQDKFWL